MDKVIAQKPPIEVHVTRGHLIESRHFVDAVVVDDKGKTVEVYGPAKDLVFPRSAIKMLQAISLVESGAFEKTGLTKSHIAIACSSHWGDEQHTDLVSSWLEKLGLSSDSLICGAHDPIDERTKRALIRQDIKPTRIHNNCSGKHTGIIAGSVIRGESHRHYERWDHSAQIRLRKILSEVCKLDLDKAPWGVDGCGIPTYAMPLENIAVGFSRLQLESELFSERKQALKLIRESVLAEPHFIAGKGAFCSEIIAGAHGKVIVKTGAEGVYCGACLNSGFSFALKARDGAGRAAEVATAFLLKSLRGLAEEEFLQLSNWTTPLIHNWEGQVVGKRFVRIDHFA